MQNRAAASLFAAGVWPSRVAVLDVRGRSSGLVRSLPVVIAELNGERYLVAMLGEKASWVQNVRAAGGAAILRLGRREVLHLEEIAPDARAAILRRSLDVAPGARPHIPVDRRAPQGELERVAPSFPTFRIVSAGPRPEA